MKSRNWMVAAWACLSLGGVCAGEDARLETLFPQRVEVYLEPPAEGGLVRLELPIEIVALCRADLSDLRLIDAQGRVVGFASDLGPPPGFRETIVTRHRLRVVDASRSRIDLPGSDDLLLESYLLELPRGLQSGDTAGPWDLVVDAGAGDHLRQVSVEAVDAAADLRAEGDALLRGSIFRMSGSGAWNDRLSLPGWPGQRLRVRLSGQGTRFLEPRISLESSWPLRSREPDWIELEVASARQSGSTTILELVRPPGVRPDRLEFGAREPAFHRRVTVVDVQPGKSDRQLGRGVIYQLPGSLDHPPLSRHELRVQPARGERLRVTIENGDSAPLREITIRAGQRRPYLIFPHQGEAPHGKPIATLFFGGGRVEAPRFDVAALLARLPVTVVADRFPPARLGTPSDNPAFSIEPILTYAHRPGASLDSTAFRWCRALSASPSPDGLNRLDLRAEDLALLQDDLRDLRIVDGQSRQWAFLIDRSARTERVAGSAERVASEDGVSCYRLRFPFQGLPLRTLLLDADAAFFDRHYELLRREERFGEPDRLQTLSQGRLARRNGQGVVRLALPATRASGLELRIHDGDDAPLVFHTVEALVPGAEIFFPAPAGEYRLLLGGDEVAPPRYELERIREVVLAVDAAPVAVRGLEQNRSYREGVGAGGRRFAFWAAILIAVAVLTYLTLRLARSPGDR
jgi:hypothetical protein